MTSHGYGHWKIQNYALNLFKAFCGHALINNRNNYIHETYGHCWKKTNSYLLQSSETRVFRHMYLL